jgi:hypothetical protein
MEKARGQIKEAREEETLFIRILQNYFTQKDNRSQKQWSFWVYTNDCFEERR